MLLAPDSVVPDEPASEPRLKGDPPLRVNTEAVAEPRSKAVAALPVFPKRRTLPVLPPRNNSPEKPAMFPPRVSRLEPVLVRWMLPDPDHVPLMVLLPDGFKATVPSIARAFVRSVEKARVPALKAMVPEPRALPVVSVTVPPSRVDDVKLLGPELETVSEPVPDLMKGPGATSEPVP